MRRPLLILAAAAGVIAVGAGTAFVTRPKPSPAAQSQAAAAEIGGPFRLVDQAGRPVTEKDLIGKPSLIFFGFTYCPEVCPTTLSAVTAWMKTLGPDADRLNLVFVTIDPERDTPKQMAAYLTSFDSRIRGLSGTPEQVAQIAREYRVYYKKVPLDGGDYTMDHSTPVYLVDASGGFRTLIAYQEPPAEAVAKLRALLRG
jgi:protein SCO1/2